jgi:hypothetical protein
MCWTFLGLQLAASVADAAIRARPKIYMTKCNATRLHLRANKQRQKVEAKQLSAALHSLQTNNDILYTEIDGLRSALLTKKKHNTRSYTMDLYQDE